MFGVFDCDTLGRGEAEALHGESVAVRCGLAVAYIISGHHYREETVERMRSNGSVDAVTAGAGDDCEPEPARRKILDRAENRGQATDSVTVKPTVVPCVGPSAWTSC